jgi:ABC-type uncharacterized transport system involved in gliding motility auxiliary subunit
VAAGKPSLMQRRGVRWGSASAVYALIVIAVLVVVNALGARYTARLDLTRNHQYTLTAASRHVLDELHQSIQIIAFVQPGSQLADQLGPLLKEYQQAGHGQVTVETVDPASHPTLARENNVVEYNTVVVKAGNSTAQATPGDFYTFTANGGQVFAGEQAITNAILRAANPTHPPVYFLQGDGEHDLGGNYSTIGEALANQGYVTHPLNLLQTASVPADAAAVVVAGPQHDLAPAEVQALKTYAQNGGHVLVLLDPTTSGPLPNLYGLLASWGVTVHDDVVVDPGRHYATDPTVPVPVYASSPITDPMAAANEPALLPAALSLDIAKNPPFEVSPLLQTDAGAYAKTDLKAQTLAFDAAKDIRGPLNLGVTVASAAQQGGSGSGQKVPTEGFRAVVIGSSTFAQDQIVNLTLGNQDLFLNSIGWLTGRTNGIQITPPAQQSNQLFLSGSATRGLFYGFVVILPLASLAVAAAVWNMRRGL